MKLKWYIVLGIVILLTAIALLVSVTWQLQWRDTYAGVSWTPLLSAFWKDL